MKIEMWLQTEAGDKFSVVLPDSIAEQIVKLEELGMIETIQAVMWKYIDDHKDEFEAMAALAMEENDGPN